MKARQCERTQKRHQSHWLMHGDSKGTGYPIKADFVFAKIVLISTENRIRLGGYSFQRPIIEALSK